MQMLGKTSPLSFSDGTDYVGIEVEYEISGEDAAGLSTPGGWQKHADGSLRNGIEYVTAPELIDGKNYNFCLSTLQKYIDKNRKKIIDSERTGTHVHFNALTFTAEQLINVLFHLYIFEEVIISTQSSKRKDNSFCLSFTNTDSIYERWTNILSRDTFSLKSLSANHKYYGVNFESVCHHGTIELRVFDTCFDTKKLDSEIHAVQDVINKYKNVSVRNTIALIDNYGLGALGVLSDKTLKTLFPNTRDQDEYVEMLMFNAIALNELDRKFEGMKK